MKAQVQHRAARMLCCLPGWLQCAQDRRWHLKQGAWRESYLGGLLDIVYIDTTPLVGKYRDEAWANTPGELLTHTHTHTHTYHCVSSTQSSIIDWANTPG